MPETHNDVIRDKHLPRVGDTVRSKKYGTLWRVNEKKESGSTPATTRELGTAVPSRPSTSATGACRTSSSPAVQDGQQPGIGKMLGYAYSLHDNTFGANWEMAN